MDWLAIAKNPTNYVLVAILMLLGVEIFPRLPGATTSKQLGEGQGKILQELEESRRELELFRQRERYEALRETVKEEVMEQIKGVVKAAVEPILSSVSKIETDMRRSSRWSLEDEVRLWQLNGEQGPDPREIQAARLGEEERERFRKGQ